MWVFDSSLDMIIRPAHSTDVCGTVGDITVRVWYSGRYYCQCVVQWAILPSECGIVVDITVRVWYSVRYYCQSVVQWAILLPVRGSGRYYFQSVVQWEILLSVCGTVGDITVRVWYSGRNYCQSVVQWEILPSECGTVGDVTDRVLLVSLKHCVGVQSKNDSTSGRQTLQHVPTNTQRCIFPNPESPVVPIYTIRFTVKNSYVLPTQCIYEFCVDLRTNRNYFPIQH